VRRDGEPNAIGAVKVVKRRSFANAILLSGNGGDPLIEASMQQAATACDSIPASQQRRGASG